jgi:hypothetical protein
MGNDDSLATHETHPPIVSLPPCPAKTVNISLRLQASRADFRRCSLRARGSHPVRLLPDRQKRKLISYSRGDITILDRDGLEAFSCGCYRADKETYKCVMG